MNEVQEKQSELVKRVKAAAKPTRDEKKLFRTNPEEASRRIKSRVDHELRMAMSERVAERFSAAYEASDSDRLRGEKWLTSKLSSNDQLQKELETLNERVLDLYRNDCYASSAVNGRVDNVIGTGIRPQSRVQAERGILTPAQAEEFNIMAEWLFSRWAKVERFYAKQRQLERCNGIFGEAWLEVADEENALKPVTMTVQVIHPQRIPLEPYTSPNGGGRRRLGLRLDLNLRPVSAYVRRTVPGDSQADEREDERDLGTQILHCYEELFPGQLRGVPWLAPAIARLKDLKDFVYANLVAEQVAACHSAFVTGVTDPVLLAENGRVRSNLEDLSPGTIQYLGDGEGIAFSDPARPGTTLAPYVEWALHGVAAALRYPYELLAKQFTNNFSGGRLALIDGRITFKVWQGCLIEQALEPVWHRFIDQCVFQGAINIDPVKYEENRDHFLQHAWIPPGWPWVDPEKEVTADLAAIAGGLQTETESLAARGRDFDETLAQREREAVAKMRSEARLMAVRKELGLPEATAPARPVGKPSASSQAVEDSQNAAA